MHCAYYYNIRYSVSVMLSDVSYYNLNSRQAMDR